MQNSQFSVFILIKTIIIAISQRFQILLSVICEGVAEEIVKIFIALLN